MTTSADSPRGRGVPLSPWATSEFTPRPRTLTYDAFGNLLATFGDVVRLPLGFAGGLFDADTCLTRFPWRDYDADTGRFTALAPMGAKGGDSDWYGYCVDDPFMGRFRRAG